MKITPIKAFSPNIRQNTNKNVSFGDITYNDTFQFQAQKPKYIKGINHELSYVDNNKEKFFDIENKSERNYGTRFILSVNAPEYKDLRIIMRPGSFLTSILHQMHYTIVKHPYDENKDNRGIFPKIERNGLSATEEFKNLAPENTVEQTSNMYTDRETNTTVFGKESLKQYEEFKRDYRIMANDIIVYSEQPESKDIDEKN